MIVFPLIDLSMAVDEMKRQSMLGNGHAVVLCEMVGKTLVLSQFVNGERVVHTLNHITMHFNENVDDEVERRR